MFVEHAGRRPRVDATAWVAPNAVLSGAVVGTTLGIRFASPAILKALGFVLLIAGLKLIGVY